MTNEEFTEWLSGVLKGTGDIMEAVMMNFAACPPEVQRAAMALTVKILPLGHPDLKVPDDPN
jgi:hypothetical protein